MNCEQAHHQIGRRWLLSGHNLTREEAVELGQRKATESEAMLSNYADRGKQVNWWPDFVRKVLGHDTAMGDFDLTRL